MSGRFDYESYTNQVTRNKLFLRRYLHNEVFQDSPVRRISNDKFRDILVQTNAKIDKNLILDRRPINFDRRQEQYLC